MNRPAAEHSAIVTQRPQRSLGLHAASHSTNAVHAPSAAAFHAPVLVVNSANPEVDRLAGELAERGRLGVFVRQYADQGRLWERMLKRVPILKRPYVSTFGRRSLLPALAGETVVDAGVACDFLAAIALRSHTGRFGLNASGMLLRSRRRCIGRTAARFATHADVVVGNYGVSLNAFENVKERGGRVVLNYPNAHHRFQSRFLREEAQREPEFACTFTTEIATMGSVYDRECDLADMILVGSSFVRRSFEEEGLASRNLVVIPYGCDLHRFFPPENPRRNPMFRVLFVGQLTQRKGLSYLLRAYRAFHGRNVELLIAGRRVVEMSTFDAYKKVFTYLGHLPQQKLSALYRDVDVFVLPTLLEGMALVVLEAMASGLPVITTSHGAGDIVRDGIDGFLVPIRDPEAIADRLETLRAHPEMRIAMGRAARQRALEFTWERYCLQAANAVLAERPGAHEYYSAPPSHHMDTQPEFQAPRVSL